MVRRKRQSYNHVEEHREDWDDSVCSNSKVGKISSTLGDAEDKLEATSTSCSDLQKPLQECEISEIGGLFGSIVNKSLAIFIISQNITFDIVEAPSFVNFVKGVAKYGPKYKLPSSETLQSKSFPEVEMEVEKYVQSVKESWCAKGCTIMFGMWRNSVNITAYSPEGAVFLKMHEIPRYEKSKFDLKEIVSSIIDDIGADNIVQIITNSDPIYETIENVLLNSHSQIYQIRCAAHEIHSLLKVMYEEVGWIRVTIDRAAQIVKFMYDDAFTLSFMKEYTKNSELKHPCRSKFASNYQMLKSILDNKKELKQLVASEKWSLLLKKKRVTKIAGIIQSENFWTQVLEVLKVMEPLVQVLSLVEDDRSTIGYMYEAMEKARETIERYSCNDHKKYGNIFDLFQKWQSNKIIHPIHAAAAFLNPSFMCRDSFKFNDEMSRGIDFVLSTMVMNEEKEKFTEEVQLYRAKISKVFNEMAHELLKVSHPRVWWDYAGVYLPVLKKYAIRILSQPCKCSCDLKPSVFDVSRTKVMNEAMDITHDNFIYTTMNAKFMEKFRSLEEQSLKPIDLENCNELPDYVDPKQGWSDDQMELIGETSDDDAKHEADFLKFDGKSKDAPGSFPHTAKKLSANSRMRWRKTIIVICTSNYLQLQRK